MKVIAAILAGGSGSRIGGETPKQMLLLGGKPVLEHSVATFDAHPGIDEILVVCREDLIPAVQALVARYAKVRAVIPGGSDRTGSSLAALRAATVGLAARRAASTELAAQRTASTELSAQRTASAELPAPGLVPDSDPCAADPLAADPRAADVCLLIHDAARPLIDEGVISRCIEALENFSAVEPAVPLSDTVIRIDDDAMLADVPPRSSLRAVQTPQCFRLDILAEAFRRHLARQQKCPQEQQEHDFLPTDDISLVRHYLPDIPVKVVPGSPRNLKLTHPSDLPLLEALLAARLATISAKKA